MQAKGWRRQTALQKASSTNPDLGAIVLHLIVRGIPGDVINSAIEAALARRQAVKNGGNYGQEEVAS